MKKLFALLLSIAMVAALAVPALADEGATTIYLDVSSANVGTVYCYAYEAGNTDNCNSAWPGVRMTHIMNGIYSVEFSSSLDTVVFIDNRGGYTDAITLPTDGKNLYSIETETWSTYVPESSPATGKGEGDYTIGVGGVFVPGTPAGDVISADIAWEAMNFTYTEGSVGTWNPDTHTYTGGTEGSWSTNKPAITVTNHSNTPLEATFAFAAADGVTTTGSFYTKGEGDVYTAITAAADQKLALATALGTTRENAPSGSLCFGVSGAGISENQALGTITVKIAKGDMIYTGEELVAVLTSLGATGGTVTLGADITLPVDELLSEMGIGGVNGCVFGVEDNKEIVLELNGHTLTGILYTGNAEGDGSARLVVQNGTLRYAGPPAELGVITNYHIHTVIKKVTITASNVAAVANIGEKSNMEIIDSMLSGGILLSGYKLMIANTGGTMTFSGKTTLDTDGCISNNDGTIKVLPGTYNIDPTIYVDTTKYEVTANANGTWTVAAKAGE